MPETIAPVFEPELELAAGAGAGLAGALAAAGGGAAATATAPATGAPALSFSTGTVSASVVGVAGVSNACVDVSFARGGRLEHVLARIDGDRQTQRGRSQLPRVELDDQTGNRCARRERDADVSQLGLERAHVLVGELRAIAVTFALGARTGLAELCPGGGGLALRLRGRSPD